MQIFNNFSEKAILDESEPSQNCQH